MARSADALRRVGAGRWAEWLAERRFGGDAETRERALAGLARIRDRVLDGANPTADDHLLDVGCGEGLIAFGALERGARAVTFADISTDLLDVCRSAAVELGVAGRCEFVEAPAEELAPVADASVDVVTTRSVLIYVADKEAAFHEFARVLRPGGRLSIFEPVNRFAATARRPGFAGYDLRGLDEIARKLHAVFERRQPRGSDPMLDFGSLDLVRLAEGAGFFPVRLRLEAVVEPLAARSWDGFLRSSGNPNIPTVGEAMEEALTPAERERLTAHLRPLVENGRGQWRMASAYLTATAAGAC